MARATTVGRSGDARIDSLLSGYAWAGGRIAVSFPDAAGDYGGGYASDVDRDGRSAQVDGFSRLSSAQVAAARLGLDVVKAAAAGFSVEGLTGLRVDVLAARSGAGDVRIANASDASTAYAYLPGTGVGGDVWLGGSGRAPRAGNYDNVTILHEIGHALGLEHPHTAAGFGRLAAAQDSPELTVMTYRPWAGGPATGYRFEAWGAPQSWMMLDIAALQEMYGADYTTNAGNTVYRWTPDSGRTLVNGAVAIDPGANRIFATVWDGGGRDTYDLSAYETGVRVDLRPGGHSVFSEGQRADLGGGPYGGHARGNIFNALLHDGDGRSLVEAAIGGGGNDRLTGNQAANTLRGGGGADVLDGQGGADRLDGGAGADRLLGAGGTDVLVGGAGADVFRFRSTAESACRAGDRLAGFDGAGRTAGDRIDLAAIDADVTRAGNQAFVLDGKVRGHLWLTEEGTASVLYGNTDGDRAPEFELTIHDGAVRAWAYTAHDFIL